MRTLLCSVLLFLSLASTASAWKPPDDIKVQFVDMSEWLIDGEIKKPQAQWISARQRVTFKPLHSMKKSFLPALQATSDARTFK